MYFSDDMRELVQLFLKHEVDFAICGGHAVAHHGHVRMTMDFDLLVSPTEINAQKIVNALEAFGLVNVGLSKNDFNKSGSVITIGEQPNQVDILTSMSSVPTEEIIDRAPVSVFQGISVKIVSYDDLLAAKKESERPKDQLDANELERLRKEDE